MACIHLEIITCSNCMVDTDHLGIHIIFSTFWDRYADIVAAYYSIPIVLFFRSEIRNASSSMRLLTVSNRKCAFTFYKRIFCSETIEFCLRKLKHKPDLLTNFATWVMFNNKSNVVVIWFQDIAGHLRSYQSFLYKKSSSRVHFLIQLPVSDPSHTSQWRHHTYAGGGFFSPSFWLWWSLKSKEPAMNQKVSFLFKTVFG